LDADTISIARVIFFVLEMLRIRFFNVLNCPLTVLFLLWASPNRSDLLYVNR
jgi:hypothetical protein